MVKWDEDGEGGVGPRGEYISVWWPCTCGACDPSWEVRIAVSEEAADEDDLLHVLEFPPSFSAEEVKREAEQFFASDFS